MPHNQPSAVVTPLTGHRRTTASTSATQLTPIELMEWRLQLSNRLQSTLELVPMLQQLFTSLRERLHIGSLSYQNSAYNIALTLGKPTRHSCHYHLQSNHESLGNLAFTRHRRFQENELELLEIAIGTLVLPLRNALCYRDALHSALRDPLTGMSNRAALEQSLQREIGLAHRTHQPLTLLVVDIDHFKRVNDHYGHPAGDCVLRDVARLISSQLRTTDLCFRYGGEEFVVLLSNTSLVDAWTIAERIRRAIGQASTTYKEHCLRVTTSIGVAELLPGELLDQLFERADQALYRAKEEGRDRICISSAAPVLNVDGADA